MKSLFRLIFAAILVSLFFCAIANADFSGFLKDGDTSYYPGRYMSASAGKDARQIARIYDPAAEARPKNLVVNGDFERPVILSYYFIDLTPPGWDGTGDFVLQGYAEAVHSGDGNQWFDLNPGMSSSTGISQTINLTGMIRVHGLHFIPGT
jgi:hypothetical protein